MSTATVASSIRIDGLIEATDDLSIEGQVLGRIHGDATITIVAGATCRSSVRCRRLLISGELIGSAVCTERIEVRRGARIVGDLRAPDIVVSSSAEVDGRIDQLPPEPALEEPSRQSVTARRGPAIDKPRPPSSSDHRSIPAPPVPRGRIQVNRKD